MSEFPFKSLRHWVDFLKMKGQLVENNEEVNLKGEIAAISQKIALTEGPAVLHNNIKGFPGWRIFSDGLTTRERIGWAVGISERNLVDGMMDKMKESENKTLKPKVVEDGPCKELKFLEGKFDLTKLPVAFTGEYDNPPFITAGVSNIRDPDTGWQNTGIRRFQQKGKDCLNNMVLPFQHEGIIFSKYIKKGQAGPVAIVIGADPLYNLISQMPAPAQFDEMDSWGAFAGRPLDVVKCETSDILVPASAEIVIEGEMDPKERVLEGPFSEFTGFYSGLRKLPIIKVKCVTMRKDPIYQNLYISIPTSEAHTMGHLMTEVMLLRQLKELVPDVTDLSILSSWGMVAAVSVKKKSRAEKPGLVKKVAVAIKAVQASAWVKNVFIVDDDVNPHNMHEIFWCMSVKFQGQKDILVIPEFAGTYLDPSELYLGKGPGVTSYTVFDCTEKPPPYDESYKRGVAQPEERFRRMVGEKWDKYGF
ncbi:MAG: UbiD family decarboxylase [Deltaproteobacteria bacterium]|nr:UbiD family decarboxylase [Deltaproteobacteria bacterium]